MLETFSEESCLNISYRVVWSPLGWIAVVGHQRGVTTLLQGGRTRRRFLGELKRRYPYAVEKEGIPFSQARLFLKNYFEGKKGVPPKIDLFSQTSFQKRVLREVQKIPYGQVRSYEWLAKKVGSPRGARACGQVLQGNPVPLLIPCHRVILKSGKKGGFAWGNRLKERLLKFETKSEKP